MSQPEFTVVHEILPRFRDTDAMGHINNAVYVTYLEVARQAYWRQLDAHSDYRRVPFTLADPHGADQFDDGHFQEMYLKTPFTWRYYGPKQFGRCLPCQYARQKEKRTTDAQTT